MTGELTLDAQNSPILAFFDFLVPEGDLGCSEQASKTLVKKFFWDFFKNRLVFGKNHEILGSRNRVLDPPRCSKVPNFAFNGLKSSKLAQYRGKKKKIRGSRYGERAP